MHFVHFAIFCKAFLLSSWLNNLVLKFLLVKKPEVIVDGIRKHGVRALFTQRRSSKLSRGGKRVTALFFSYAQYENFAVFGGKIFAQSVPILSIRQKKCGHPLPFFYSTLKRHLTL